VPLEELSFSSMLPSSGRAGVSTVFDYVLWLHNSREISVRTEGLVVSWQLQPDAPASSSCLRRQLAMTCIADCAAMMAACACRPNDQLPPAALAAVCSAAGAGSGRSSQVPVP
jgi:hypothetical protein